MPSSRRRLRRAALLVFSAFAGCTLVQTPAGPPAGGTISSSGAPSSGSGDGAGSSGATGTSGSSSSGQSSSGSTGGSSGSSSGTTGSSSGASGQSSSGTTGGSSGTTGGSTGGLDAGCPPPAGSPWVLATDDVTAGGVWDLGGAGSAFINGGDWGSDHPNAVAIDDTNKEVLVLTDTSGLWAFDIGGASLGQVQIPFAPGEFQGGTGIAILPQCSGPPLAVVCGDSSTVGFYYAGPTSNPTRLWENPAGCGQATPGPGATFFATSGPTVVQYDALTGNSHGSFFAQSQGGLEGAAMAADGTVLVAGDDGDGNGFVALMSRSGVCQQARSGGTCTLSCSPGPCTPNDPTLAAMPLHQAAALSGGAFVVTVSTTAPTKMQTVWRVDPGSLALTSYFSATSGVDFYGLTAGLEP